ncbi:MAG: hypothetical protein HYV27_19375 [Candidatus Hydrogenedentes bacterium]|nr:hypothetical protein [Candidatus Hydrogenedentota bacterium]
MTCSVQRRIQRRFTPLFRQSQGLLCAALGAGFLFTAPAPAQETPDTFFAEKVWPILEARCISCHGVEKQKGDLRLDSAEAILKGTDDGPILVAGKPEESKMCTLTGLPAGHDDIMPPKGDPLTPEQVATLQQWVAAGANFGAWTAPPAPAPADPGAPAPAEPAPVPDAAAAGGDTLFADKIWPIFEANCVSCHGAEKQKAELRLDSAEAILKGAEDGPVLVAGKPEESKLYSLTILPAGHDDIMPAKGDPLTAEQTGLIQQWIAAGAGFGAWTSAPVVAAGPAKVDVLAQLAEGVAAAPADVVAKIEGRGALAMPLAASTPLMRVSYQLAKDQVNDESLAELAGLADQLTWLNLAGSPITDASLAHLQKLPKLTELHLEKTPITDAGVANLTSLSHLEYLNLYGTEVSDAALESIAALPNLKKLYVWQTKVTAEGAKALQAKLPELNINLGAELEVPVAPEAVPAVDPLAKFDADSCCFKAAQAGGKCDHPCCVEAEAAGKVCTKCNPGKAEAAPAEDPLAKFDADSCCFKAAEAGGKCDHPCCVEAEAAGKVCTKCNPGKA